MDLIRSFIIAGYAVHSAWLLLLTIFLVGFYRNGRRTHLAPWAFAIGWLGLRTACSGMAVILARRDDPGEAWRTGFSAAAQLGGYLFPLYLITGALIIYRGRGFARSHRWLLAGVLSLLAFASTWWSIGVSSEARLMLRLGVPSLLSMVAFWFSAWCVTRTHRWTQSFGRVALVSALILYGVDQSILAAVRITSFYGVTPQWSFFLGYPDLLWSVLFGLGVLVWQLEEERDDKREAFRQLRMSEEQLLQTQKMQAVGQLAGGIAHDFNNVLTAIMGNSTLMETKVQDDPEGKELLDQILAAGEHASSLVHRLMSFSRQHQVQPRALDPNRSIQRSIDMVRSLIPPEIQLDLDLKAETSAVFMDQSQLEMVLVNLIVNARDAMPDGGRLSIRTLECEQEIMVEVQDNGIGMSTQTRQRIFEPFFTTKKAGNGIGLASVSGAIQSAGGTISVVSQEGEGTTFTLHLPACLEEPANRCQVTEDEAPGVSTGTVLVVDDDPQVLAFAVRALRTRGFEVLEARDGRKAIEVARAYAGDLDLLLTDVRMPHMGGEELAQLIGIDRPSTPVLFMTGFSDGADLDESASGVMMKPFTAQELRRRVRANCAV
jgi:signal transduction histidine kinase